MRSKLSGENNRYTLRIQGWLIGDLPIFGLKPENADGKIDDFDAAPRARKSPAGDFRKPRPKKCEIRQDFTLFEMLEIAAAWCLYTV